MELISRQAAIDALEALAAKDTNVLSNDCISYKYSHTTYY